MLVTWKVDDATTLELEARLFAPQRVRLNGAEIAGRVGRRDLPFPLGDGRLARIRLARRLFSPALAELWVDDRLMVPSGKNPLSCVACKAAVNPNSERFCRSCGQQLPQPEHYVNQRQLGEATGAIWGLSVLFVIGGIVFFFIARSNTANLLASLELHASDEIVTTTTGLTMSAADLRQLVLWQEWGPLVVNLILAAIMVGLAFWSRRSPLAAVLVAAAIYVVVIVTNGIIDPATVAQGIIMKIIVILFLFRGIKAGLALRTANA